MKFISLRNRYKKIPLALGLTYYILLMPFLFGTFTLLNIPSLVRYTVDAAWMGTVLLMACQRKLRFRRILLPQICLISIWLLFTLIVYLFRYQSMFYYLWGIRNNVRFYVAFLMFASFLDEENVDGCLKLFDKLFWVNAVVVLIQFFFLGYQQDFLGGIFGVEKGANAYTVVFFCVVLSKSLLSMMNGTESLGRCLLKCGCALLIAALAEMFAFYLFFVTILILASVCTKFSWKKSVLFVAMAIVMVLCSSILLELFGKGSQLTIETFLKRLYAENYATQNDLGRLTAVPTLAKRILTDAPEQWFGLGLGNCDTSAFAICNTPFYQRYMSLHYTWFMSAFLFLETGYLGIVLYVCFFVLCFASARKHIKNKQGNLLYCQLTQIMSVICMIMTLYNAVLRTEGGYMAYFVLALAFIKRRDESQK